MAIATQKPLPVTLANELKASLRGCSIFFAQRGIALAQAKLKQVCWLPPTPSVAASML